MKVTHFCLWFLLPPISSLGARCWWHSWFRHCATRRKVAGSIPDGVIEIFNCHNPSGRTMTLWLTQPLTEMRYQEYFLGVKAAGAYGWQPYHLHVPIVLKSGSLNLLEPSGPVQACNGIALPFPFTYIFLVYLQFLLFLLKSIHYMQGTAIITINVPTACQFFSLCCPV